MRGLIFGIAAALALPAQSFALTVLCVETGSTGFNWRSGEWVQTNYKFDQYLIQDVSEDYSLRGLSCVPEPPVTSDWGTVTAKRCFNSSTIGKEKEPLNTVACTVRYGDDKEEVAHVSCEGIWESYSFVPNGEFVLSRTYSAPVSEPAADASRDSLVLSVGKCSVVAP